MTRERPSRAHFRPARALRGLAPATLLAAALLLASCSGPDSAGKGGEIGAPQWIWRAHDLRHVEVAAFYAVREIELGAIRGAARVRVRGDEEYMLWINGRRIGSGPIGQAGDEYDVTRFLETGRNRIVAELRSTTGAGGFWFELADEGGRRARSDGDWTIYHGEWRGLFRGGAMIPGERPVVFGAGPVARWAADISYVQRPLFQDVLVADEPFPARLWREWNGGDDPWKPARERQRRPPNLGPLVEFDFGEPVTGYLQLAFRDTEASRELPALVKFGLDPIAAPPVESDVIFRPIPGRNLFQDGTARSFRYVAVAGLRGLFSAEVLGVKPEELGALGREVSKLKANRGVFGVTPPPPSGSPMEHEVWRELERTAGLARRKLR